jgi:hypothetical protein
MSMYVVAPLLPTVNVKIYHPNVYVHSSSIPPLLPTVNVKIFHLNGYVHSSSFAVNVKIFFQSMLKYFFPFSVFKNH